MSINTVVLDALTAEIERVKGDQEFINRLARITERDKKDPRPAGEARGLALAEALVIAEAVTGLTG